MSAAVDENGYVRRPGAWQQVKQILIEASKWHELIHTPYGLTPIVLMCGALLIANMAPLVFSLAGPQIAQDLNLNLAIIAGIFSISYTSGYVVSLFFGWLGDRVKRTWMLGAGLVVGGLMSIAQGRAVNTATYAPPAVANQVAGGVSLVPTYSLIADWYPRQFRGRAFALQSVATATSGIIGFLALGLVLEHVSWRVVVTVLSIPVILLGLAIFALKEPVRGYFERKEMGLSEEAARRESPPQSFGEAWRTTFSVRTMRRLFLFDLLLGMGAQPFNIYLSFFLADQYGLDVQARSLFLVPGLIVGLIGNFIGGGLMDAFSRRNMGSITRLMSVYIGIGLAGLVGFALAPPLAVLVLFMTVFYFAISLTNAPLQTIYASVMPPAIRTQATQVTALAKIPGYIALYFYAAIVSSYGFPAMFASTLPFVLLSVLVVASMGDTVEPDLRNNLIVSAAAEEARVRREEGRGKLLVCRSVDVSYDGTQVLFGVDFDVDDGELIALLGTNGAGKSTLLRAIAGIQEASDGAVNFDGRDITHMPPHEIAKLGVVTMPGGKGVFPNLSVEENLLLGTWLLPGGREKGALAEAYEIFPALARRKRSAAGLLSGGEQQMLGLAMAFMTRPKLLMIDELSLGLSPAAVAELLEKVREINRRGTTVIVVEQSVNVALTLARRAIFMEKGEVKFAGPTEDLLRRPDILRAVYVKGTTAVTSTAGVVAENAARRRREQLADSQVLLEVRGLTKAFGGIRALDGVDLTLSDGQILGIVGPNGSGKTTLFDCISGYLTPDSGHVFFAGRDVTHLAAYERSRLGLVRRFQDARLFPALTVFETLLLALDRHLEVRNGALVAIQAPAARRAERRTRLRAERLIETLELGAYRDKFVRELSTGLRRIADLAFVLASEPKVLLLDEPSSGIAQAEAESLGPLLRRVRKETGCSMLLIEHDIPLITAVADDLLGMVTGRVVARGSADEVLNDPTVVEAFLGSSDDAIQRSGAPV